MAKFQLNHIGIKGVAAAVPKNKESNQEYTYLTEEERKLLIQTTGVRERRVEKGGKCTSDFCLASAEKLLNDLKWDREELGILIFVSQSPDYYLPATSIILQNKLGLNKNCLAFDINLGCSGYVYGLSVIGSLMTQAGIKKGLLLCGDISSFSLNPKDKSTYPIFGDAGTATALELSESDESLHFSLNSDGSGFQSIIIPDGGTRNPISENSFKEEEQEKGIVRSKRNLHLNGLDVFNFSLKEVAKNIQENLQHSQVDLSEVDRIVFHQANKLILKTVAKKLKIEEHKYPISIDEFGNTSSASIPLTMVTRMRNKTYKNIVLSGFGVGLSWGSVLIKNPKFHLSELIELE